MMKMFSNALFLGACVALCSLVPNETAAQSGTEQLPWWVVASGGVVDATSGSTLMSATLGQTVIGPTAGSAAGGSVILHQGFWYPRASVSGVEVEPGDVVAGLSTLRNYPNPFVGSTTIHYVIPGRSRVNLSIYNMQGELVRVLVDGIEDEGTREIVWDGRNSRGEEMASGPYLYVLDAKGTTGDNSRTKNLNARQIMQRLK